MNLLKCSFGVHKGDFVAFIVHKKGIVINQNKTKAIVSTSDPITKKQLQSLLGKINFLKIFISNLSGKTQFFSPLLRMKKEDGFKWESKHHKAFEEIKIYRMNPLIILPPARNILIKLYISTSDVTIRSMLTQEDDDGVQRAIYYLSRVLNNAETIYSSIQKLCLCIYFSCINLKYYIKHTDVFVYSQFNVIKHTLFKPILHNSVGKWALALTGHSLTYAPLKVVKGQVMDGFIVDHAWSTWYNFL